MLSEYILRYVLQKHEIPQVWFDPCGVTPLLYSLQVSTTINSRQSVGRTQHFKAADEWFEHLQEAAWQRMNEDLGTIRRDQNGMHILSLMWV